MKAREADKAVRHLVFQHSQNLKAKAHNEKVDEDNKERPLVVEKVTERVLISIPEKVNGNELVAILSAIHYYIEESQVKAAAWSSMRKNYRKDLTLFVDIHCSYGVVEFVTRLLDLPVYDDLNKLPQPITAYDMYCRFDLQLIKQFRENGKFHASSAYGIMLGCEAQSLFTLPIDKIIAGVESRMPVHILVIDDVYFSYVKVWQWLGIAVPHLKVSRVVPYMNQFRAMVTAIHDAALIVGPASEWTYIASCMKKPVFEIYPPAISRNWLSKWSNPLYAMYVSKPEDLDNDKLVRGVAMLWQRAAAILQVAQSKPPVLSAISQEQIQMGQLPSDADSAVTV